MADRHNKSRMLGYWIALICLVLPACQHLPATTQPLETAANAGTEGPGPSTTPSHHAPLTLTPPVSMTAPVLPESPAPSPSPTPIGPQVVLNSGFDEGVGHWLQPYGKLEHTTSVYHTAPGAAVLITNSSTGFLDYRGSTGQCIDLEGFLSEWPRFESQMYMTLEVYLQADPNITNISLNGIFLADSQCGTEQVGHFVIPSLAGNPSWTRAAGTRSVPAEARSLHVFINATGTTPSAAVFIDDLRAFAAEPPPE